MEEERKVLTLNIDDILPNRFQPRIKFNETAINELAESIKLHGVIQPIVVRKISDKYEIIAGERRYKASVIAGKTTIPAIVTTLDDKNSAEIALIENIQRQDLTPIEEAISYKKIIDMGISQQELGLKLGKNQSTIANKLRLLNLDDEVQEALMENKISERHARSLLRLDIKRQILMLNRIINERLTVRKTDLEIAKMLENDDNGEQKIIKEEGDNMNNDILKDFNIPTEPIVGDNANESITFNNNQVSIDNVQPSVQSAVSSAEAVSIPEPIVDNPAVSPIPNQQVMQPIQPDMSFVGQTFEPIQGVEQSPIQNVANPVPQVEQQAVTSEQVDTPISQPSLNPEPVSQPVEDAERPRGGKFFNMFNLGGPKKEEIQTEPVENNANINDAAIQPNPFNPVIENTNPTSNALDVFGQNDININAAPAGPTPNEIQESQPIPTPIVDNPVVSPIPEPIVQESPQIEAQNDNMTQLPFGPSIQQAALTDDGFKTEEPTIIPNLTPNNNYVNYMMDDDVKFDDEGEIEVQLPSQNQPAVTVDMKTVINTIRECAKTIEQYGYRVETDELDLADSYEVTFKIQKND